MLLDLSLGLKKESEIIIEAVKVTLDQGFRTADMVSSGEKSSSTREISVILTFLFYFMVVRVEYELCFD